MRTEAWLRLMSGLVLVGIFAAGALFGAGLMRFSRPDVPRPPPHGGPIQAMEHQLALDAEQRSTLRAIADAHREELEMIGREAQGRVRRVLFTIEDELAPALRPDQRERLAQWRATRRSPPGGHRPPPPGALPPPPPPAGGP